MKTIYKSGSIISFTNMKMYDCNGKLQVRPSLNGCFFILLNDVQKIGDTSLCLKVSFKKKHKGSDKYCCIPSSCLDGGIEKEIYVNLKIIYHLKTNEGILTKGSVLRESFENLISKIKFQ